jgi:hypothetical protein
MSIELHCPQCRKLIRAPDDAGGKRGKCPYCGDSVYIPMPPDESDDIHLAPVDEDSERREEELRREAIKYVASVDKATDLGPDPGDEGPSPPVPRTAGQLVDLGDEVEAFIIAMRDSKLAEADKVVARLKKMGDRARDYVEGLVIDQMPLEVEDVPEPVVQGFLRTLLSRLG